MARSGKKTALVAVFGLVAAGTALVALVGWWSHGEVLQPSNAQRLGEIARIEGGAYRAGFDRSGRRLFVLRFHEAVAIHDLTDFKSPPRRLGERCTHFAFGEDGTVAYAADSSVTIVGTDGASEVSYNSEQAQPALAFSPDGTVLASGGYGDEVTLLRVRDGAKMVAMRLSGMEGARTPTFSPDGRTLAIGNRNGVTELCDAATGRMLLTLRRGATQGLAFSPDGRTLAICYVDGKVGLWDVKTGKQQALLDSQGEEAYAVAWNPAGDLFATGGLRCPILLWDAASRTVLHSIPVAKYVMSLAFSPDGRLLVSCDAEATVVWATGGTRS